MYTSSQLLTLASPPVIGKQDQCDQLTADMKMPFYISHDQLDIRLVLTWSFSLLAELLIWRDIDNHQYEQMLHQLHFT